MKKSIALVLALAVLTSSMFAAKKSKKDKKAPSFKVGVIYIGDENEGYTEAHMKGVAEMKKTLGLTDAQVIEKKGIPESEKCYDAAIDLAEQGCTYIIATSFGHESYLIQAAKEYPKIVFAHATGYQAASTGLKNMHNFMPSVYQSRYVSGIVAGLKLNEMISSGKSKASEAKIGYVGAYPYAEVVSGYTSFFLGARSICPSATMEVRYTNSWADMSLEKETAEALIAAKCVLISQHADTTGAPSACEAHGVPCVGYNVDMTAVAPNAALTSAALNWGAFYTMSAKAVKEGKDFEVNWSRGYSDFSGKQNPPGAGTPRRFRPCFRRAFAAQGLCTSGCRRIAFPSFRRCSGYRRHCWHGSAGAPPGPEGYGRPAGFPFPDRSPRLRSLPRDPGSETGDGR